MEGESETVQKRKAFDVCPGNIILNSLCREELGIEYDPEGEYASRGKIVESLLDELDNLQFFKKCGPKSLGQEQVELDFMSLIRKYS